ncbi:MAG: site-specific integrase [Gemmatimonadales bacterium]
MNDEPSKPTKKPGTAKRRKRKPSKVLGRYGRHGRTVRVWRVSGTDKVMLQYRFGWGDRKTESFRGEFAEERARARARFLADGSSDEPAIDVPVGAVWADFKHSHQFTELAPRSQALYEDAWRLFSMIVPERTPTSELTSKSFGEFVTQLAEQVSKRGRPYSYRTVRNTAASIKSVFTWAHATAIVPSNPLRDFRMKRPRGKAAQARVSQSPPEFSNHEFRQLLAALDRSKPSEHRAYVLLCILGYQGPRINAALHLRWSDIDWEGKVVRWRPEWDKMGNDRYQPLRKGTLAALRAYWRAQGQPTGDTWLFPSTHSLATREVWSYQSFWAALRRVERRANVTHQAMRGAHGFRRMVAGNVAHSGKSAVVALHAIGDRDLSQATHYIKEREEAVRAVFDELDRDLPPDGDPE